MWDAEDECVAQGGHLASIHSDDDKEAIASLGNTNDMWIGFHDSFSEAGCTGQSNDHTEEGGLTESQSAKYHAPWLYQV